MIITFPLGHIKFYKFSSNTIWFAYLTNSVQCRMVPIEDAIESPKKLLQRLESQSPLTPCVPEGHKTFPLQRHADLDYLLQPDLSVLFTWIGYRWQAPTVQSVWYLLDHRTW